MAEQINKSTNAIFDALLVVINTELAQLNQQEERETEQRAIEDFRKRLAEERNNFRVQNEATEEQQVKIRSEASCIQFIIGELCYKIAITKKEIENWQAMTERHEWSDRHIEIQLKILKTLEEQKTEYVKALLEYHINGVLPKPE